MPIYEYVCQQCGHQLDALQKMADDPLLDCPECHEAALKRKISAPSFRLKGQGWYETDFKKDKQRNLADGGDAKSAASDDKGGAGKADGAAKETKTDASKSGDSKSSGGDKSSSGGKSSGDGKTASA